MVTSPIRTSRVGFLGCLLTAASIRAGFGASKAESGLPGETRGHKPLANVSDRLLIFVPMNTGRKNRRGEIVDATVRLVARQGVSGASIRQIASEAGVTEGALYRHFASKDDLCQQAYQQIVADMVAEKEQMLRLRADSLSVLLRHWIRLSFEYFDRYPEAFTYVLLTTYDFTESDITRRQGRMFSELLAEATRAGEFPEMDPVLAMSHFSGLMLNIPRLINEGTLAPPALQYVDSVPSAVNAVFGLRTKPE